MVRAKDVDEVPEDGSLDEIGVQLGHTVNLLGPDNGQERHANHLRLGLFDNGHSSQELTVFRELALDALQEEQVDIVDDLQMSREEVLEEWNGPFLQCFGEHGMVSVSKGLGHDVPCLVPLKTFEVDQNALQFHNRKSRMGIIELDGYLVGELTPRALGLLESADDIKEGCCDPEVLLLQSEFFASFEVVVGVQHS